jgi:hypothetical protein
MHGVGVRVGVGVPGSQRTSNNSMARSWSSALWLSNAFSQR